MVNPFDIIQEELRELKELVKAMPSAPRQEEAEIINTEELCKRLAISEPTAISMRKRKQVPFFLIGSAVRYNWTAVVKALEAKAKIKC
jgi:hypothetical protein